jgi:protein-tyrosine phosphatase
VKELDQALSTGKNVGIHCRQGIGRSATIASSLLVMRGIDPEEALIRVANARGCRVPDTIEQREWIRSFAHYLFALKSEREPVTPT